VTCTPFTTPEGLRGIICTSERRKRCCKCGRPADLLCDWKVPEHRSGTCDTPICAEHTHVPAADKDLCPKHAAEWKARQP